MSNSISVSRSYKMHILLPIPAAPFQLPLSKYSPSNLLRRRTLRSHRHPLRPRNSLPPIHADRSHTHQTMRNRHRLERTALTIHHFSPRPRRDSDRAAERRSRGESAGASGRSGAGGDCCCAGMGGGGGEGAADLVSGGVSNLVDLFSRWRDMYNVAIWAGGCCAEGAGVAVRVGGYGVACWRKAALCSLCDGVCASCGWSAFA